MQRQASYKQYGRGIVSIGRSILLDAPIIDWPDRLADPMEEDDLAYSFFALLDDAELREVFGDFMVRANTSD